MLGRYAKNMKPFTTILPFLILLFSSSFLSAHQDTALKFDKGNITGLPKQYSPAGFDTKTLTLSISKKDLKFPKVLQRLLTQDVDDGSGDPFGDTGKTEFRSFDLKFSASWYHESIDDDSLPPYMLMTFSSKDQSFSIELLIDMDKLEFIYANILVKNLGSVPIDLKHTF
jgi:hypothetical protein